MMNFNLSGDEFSLRRFCLGFRVLDWRTFYAGIVSAMLLAGCASSEPVPKGAKDVPTRPVVTAPVESDAKPSASHEVPGPVTEQDDSSTDDAPQASAETPPRRVGEATYYASYFEGRLTASGEPYDSQAMTAAHKTLPFGTKVKVTHLDTGETAVVRINDRGPFVKGRIIDVSEKAAERLGLIHDGAAEVQLQVLGP